MKRGLSILVAALLLLGVGLVGASPLAHALVTDEQVKITVLGNYTLNQLDARIYNTTSQKLVTLDTTKVSLTADTIQDLATDGLQAVLLLTNLSAPTVDINTNETVITAYDLSGIYADSLVVAVADVNDTTGAVSNMQYYKITPASGEIVIARTSSDIIVYTSSGAKLSMGIANLSSPHVMLMLDDGQGQYLTASNVQLLELRAVRNPPSGFTLLRNQATGEAEFTVQASGPVTIWFDESHQGGDVDLFIFDSSNSNFASAGTSQTWSWLLSHSTRHIFADLSPSTASLNANGQLKFVVKRYSGNAASVTWSVAIRLDSSNTNPGTTTTTQPSNNQTNTTTSGWGDYLAGLTGAFEGSGNSALIVIVVVVILLILAIVLRRR